MAVTRGIEDIERALPHHGHEHAPVRDLNREADRRRGLAGQAVDGLARAVGSWTFIAAQLGVIAAWLLANLVGAAAHWDPFPFWLLNLLLSFESALWASVLLMVLNRSADRDRLRAQQDYEVNVKMEEEVRQLMTHLEVQDEVLMQVLQRLDRGDRELRRLARRLGVEERAG